MCVHFARRLFTAALLLLLANTAQAQFLGHNFGGDSGLMAASQPDPGIYISPLYIGYRGDTLRDRNGEGVAIDPDGWVLKGDGRIQEVGPTGASLPGR